MLTHDADVLDLIDSTDTAEDRGRWLAGSRGRPAAERVALVRSWVRTDLEHARASAHEDRRQDSAMRPRDHACARRSLARSLTSAIYWRTVYLGIEAEESLRPTAECLGPTRCAPSSRYAG